MKITSAEFMKGIRGTDSIQNDGLPQIAFVGRSNVGKSSVISGLMQNKVLVKISDKPGKTTEINFFKVNGDRYFVDLPGYGYARMGPEQKDHLRKLIHWFLSSTGEADVRVALILDVKAGFTEFDRETLELLRAQSLPHIIVANKIDKLNQKDLATQLVAIRAASNEQDVVLCSATTKGGLDELEACLEE